MKNIPKKDLIVMTYLRQNARMKLTTMSRLTRLPVSTIFDRMKTHEGGIIKRNACLLDFQKMGFNARANVMFKVGREDKKEFMNFMKFNPNVNSIFKVNNGYDILVETIFKTVNETEYFLEDIEEKFEIKRKDVHYVIDDVKREEFLSDPDMIDVLKIAG